MKINEIINEHIVKVEGGYRLLSHNGKNLGTFPTKAKAEKHEREVQYFKHMEEGESAEDTFEGDVISMNTRKVIKPEPMSMLQAFGSDQANIINSLGISLVEKPSYWEDLKGIGDLNLAKLSKLLKRSGYNLKTYSTKDIYGMDPKGPQSSVLKMPPEEMFIIQFMNGNRYLVDRIGARSYIRNWAKI